MKKLLLLFLISAVALAVFGCVNKTQEVTRYPDISRMADSGQAGMPVNGGNRQFGIWVTGEGKAIATPDILLLNLGVEAQAKAVGEAQSTARQAMSRVRQALTANGIEDKDIKSTSYSIQPVYQYIQRENRQELTGYRVSDRISVKIRNIQIAGKVIDSAAEAGGNSIRIDSISFTIDDPTPLKNEAREKAVKDGVSKAKQMAELAGVKLGKAIYITESGFVSPPPRPFPAPMMLKAESAGAATEISPGEAEIQVQVQIAFTIE